MSPEASKVRRAIIYCRVSDSKQEEGYSFDFQEEQCREFCQEKGLHVLDVVLESHTAIELDERPVMSEIRQLMRRHEFDVLVVWKYDRFSRDQVQQAVLLYEARKYGVEVLSVKEVFDDSPLGQFMRSVMGFVAQVEHANIKLRTSEGKKKRIASGKRFVGRKAAFGYQWADEPRTHYEINPSEAAIIQRIFTMAVDGESLHNICRILNAESIPSPLGKQWQLGTVHRFIRNSMYWGKSMVYRYRQVRETKVDEITGETRIAKVLHRSKKEDEIPYSALNAPAIVSPEIAAVANEAIDKENSGGRVQKHPERFLLRGILICAHCGKNMSCRLLPRWGPQYRCSSYEGALPRQCIPNTILSNRIEPFVWLKVEEILRNPELVERELERLQAEYNDPTAIKREALTAHLSDIKRQQDNLTKHLARMEDSEDSAVPLIGNLKLLAEQKKKVELELSNADQAHVTWEQARIGMNHLREWCDRLAMQEELSFDEKRAVLFALNVRVKTWKFGHDPRIEIEMRPLSEPRSEGINKLSQSTSSEYEKKRLEQSLPYSSPNESIK